LRCNILLIPIIKKNLKKTHDALVKRLAAKAHNATASGLQHAMDSHHTESRILSARNQDQKESQDWEHMPQSPSYDGTDGWPQTPHFLEYTDKE
jgi:hypothetical protein